MKIETKFSNGDTVYLAYSDYGPVSQADCPECNGRGSFAVEGKVWRMKCTGYGCRDGKVQVSGPKPYVRSLTIGQVRVSVTDSKGGHSYYDADNYKAQHGREEEYMACETGVGSGSLYRVERLFATEEEALAYATLVLVPQQIKIRQEQDEREERDRQMRLRQIESEDAA